MVGYVVQVGSQSRPGTSVGVGEISLCKAHKVSEGLRPMGSNANLGKECVGVGKTWMSHFDPRALLDFVCMAKKQQPKTLESRTVEVRGWELTKGGFRRYCHSCRHAG